MLDKESLHIILVNCQLQYIDFKAMKIFLIQHCYHFKFSITLNYYADVIILPCRTSSQDLVRLYDSDLKTHLITLIAPCLYM